MTKTTNNFGYKLLSNLDNLKSNYLLEKVRSGTLETHIIFKDDRKCYVAKCSIDIISEYFIIKIPRARLVRYWEKFLTLFRAGESFRQFNNFKKLQTLDFKGPTPLLAAEKRRWGMVVDSFMIYTYVDGRLATSDDVATIAPELIRLLNLGFTRKDPHPENFIITKDGVYFIDFNIKKPLIFNKLRCCMEYCKFLETSPEGFQYIDRVSNSTYLFALANKLQRLMSDFRKKRRRISKILKKE